MMGRRNTQQLPGMAVQRINKNAFGGMALSLSVAVHTTAPLSQAKINPVGSAVTCSLETRYIDQGFQQQGLDLIVGPPIVGQLSDNARQQVAGEIVNLNPRAESKTGCD